MGDVLRPTTLGQTGLAVSSLGLGCSHIASLSTRPDAQAIARLLDAAYEGGVRFFDTADVYGQGDSERRLAGIAARPGTVICTKAGLRIGRAQGLVRVLKPALRPLVQARANLRHTAATLRASSETVDLNPDRLIGRLRGSLGRLRRDGVDVFLLHSPPRAALEDGVLFDMLTRIREAGLASVVGVSCRTLEDAAWVLERHPVDAVQVPLFGSEADIARVLDTAARAGVGVIAREVMAGAADRSAALALALTRPNVHVTLCGTTDIAHLRQNIALARGA